MLTISNSDRKTSQNGVGASNALEEKILTQLRRRFKKGDLAALERRRNVISLFKQIDPLKAAIYLRRLKKYRKSDELSRLFHGELHEGAAIIPVLKILKRKVQHARQLLKRKDNLEFFIRVFSNHVTVFFNSSSNIDARTFLGSDKNLNILLGEVEKVILYLHVHNNPSLYNVDYNPTFLAFHKWETLRSKVESTLNEYENIASKNQKLLDLGWGSFDILDQMVVNDRVKNEMENLQGGIANNTLQNLAFHTSNDLKDIRNLFNVILKIHKKSKKVFNNLEVKGSLLPANSSKPEDLKYKIGSPAWEGLTGKLKVLKMVWNAPNLLVELKSQQSKRGNRWLDNVSNINELLKLSLQITKQTIVANLKLAEFATRLAGHAEAVSNIQKAIGKVSVGFATPLALLSFVSSIKSLVDAIESGNPVVIITASTSVLSASISTFAAIASIGKPAAIAAFTLGGAALLGGALTILATLVKIADMLGGFIRKMRDKRLRKSAEALYLNTSQLAGASKRFITAYMHFSGDDYVGFTRRKVHLDMDNDPLFQEKTKNDSELDKKRRERLQKIIIGESTKINKLIERIKLEIHELKHTAPNSVIVKIRARNFDLYYNNLVKTTFEGIINGLILEVNRIIMDILLTTGDLKSKIAIELEKDLKRTEHTLRKQGYLD